MTAQGKPGSVGIAFAAKVRIVLFSISVVSGEDPAPASTEGEVERVIVTGSNIEAWNNTCAAYNKLGRYEQAAAACQQALRYKPDLQLARNNLQYARDIAKAATP
jgi:tetratricopeptide (TPR) repeat protein